MRSFIFLAAFAAAPLAAQSTPAKQPTSARVTADTAKLGTYDLELTTNDGTMTGELSLAKDGAETKASLRAVGNKPDVKSFVREGGHYVLTGGHGNFTVVYTLQFSRDSVSGTFKLSGGMSGTVIGALRR